MEYTEKREELKNIKVDLDKDPVAVGLLTFNEKLAEIDAFSDRVSTLLLEAIENRSVTQEKLQRTQETYDRAYNKILATDDKISSLRSTDLRVAKANESLQEKLDDLTSAKTDFTLADGYYKEVYQVYSRLESKSNHLVKQISVVQTMTNIDPSVRYDLQSKNIVLKKGGEER